MSYYSGRKPKTTSKPTVIHNENIPTKDLDYILEEIVASHQRNISIKISQEDLSKKLSLHFEKSVGVNIVEGGEQYEEKVKKVERMEPSLKISFN